MDDWFFLAMSHWCLGDREQAHQWYERSVDWMEKKKGWPDLQRWRAEAAELLGIDEEPTSEEQEGPSRNDES